MAQTTPNSYIATHVWGREQKEFKFRFEFEFKPNLKRKTKEKKKEKGKWPDGLASANRPTSHLSSPSAQSGQGGPSHLLACGTYWAKPSLLVAQTTTKRKKRGHCLGWDSNPSRASTPQPPLPLRYSSNLDRGGKAEKVRSLLPPPNSEICSCSTVRRTRRQTPTTLATSMPQHNVDGHWGGLAGTSTHAHALGSGRSSHDGGASFV